MDRLKRVTKGVVLRTIATFSSVLLGMAVSLVLNRYYGKTEYALLVLVYTVTNLCFLFSDMGSKATLLRYIPRYSALNERKKLGDIISTSIIIQITGIGVFAIVIYFLATPISIFIFHKNQLIPVLKLGAIFFVGVSIAEFLSVLFQSMQTWWRDTLVSILYPLIYFLLVYLFSFILHLPIKFSLCANAISGLIILIISIFIFPKPIKSLLFRNLNLNSIFSSLKKIYSFGLPLLLSTFTFYILNSLDKIMLGRYQPNEMLTFYYIAFLFISGFLMLFKVLYSVLMPYLAEISIQSHDNIKGKFHLIFNWFLQATILTSLCLYFLIEPLVKTLYGSDYYPSIIIFRLLLIVFFLRATGHPTTMFLINVYGKSKQAFLLSLSLVSTLILFNILLIPKYGYSGAVAALIIGFLVRWSVLLAYIKIIRRMFPVKIVIKSLACAASIALIFLPLKSIGIKNVYILGFGLPLIYLLLIKLFNVIRDEDIGLIKKIIGIFAENLQSRPIVSSEK